MPRLSLRTKLLIAFLVVLLPLLALIVYGYTVSYKQRSEDIMDEQVRTSQAIGALVDASIDDALAVAWSFSKDPIVRTMDSRQIDPYLESLATSLPQYDSLAVLDSEGNSVGLSLRPPPGAPRPGATGRPYFQALKSTHQPAISDVLISRATGNPTVAVVVPMLDDSGALMGATVAALDLDYLAQRVETIGVRPSQGIFLSDTQGTMVFHTLLAREEWGQRSLADYPPVQTALGGAPARIREMKGLSGDERIVSATRTPKYAWVVGVSTPVAVALAPLQDTLRYSLLFLSGAIVFSGGLAILLAEFLVRPLRQLTRSAVALGKGERQAVEIHTGDELEQLAGAFTWMADAVSDKEAQLRGHAQQLNQEVQERVTAQRQLEQVNHELEAFSYSVSHDLRAPLRAIDGFSHAVLEDYADKLDEEGKQYLQRMCAASKRMERLIDDLLKLSRITRAELRREEVDLSAMAQEITAELRDRQPEREVQLVVTPRLVADGDPRLLRVVLENLLSNAWKFTSKHPRARIELGVTEHEGKPAYFVRDDGAGFDMAYAEKLFGAFQRLHSAEEFPGTGIGLATVQRIINRHGGRIWAEGAVDEGATFYFTLQA
ncbi:MAG: HAMP domain-containing protein [Chloroflexota bacterium]|nr:MAG: HAMP domain-containing protein [Chloroflexota bacterium]